MPNRILREGINDSRAVNELSMMAELFYRKLMSIVDDYGRYEADPQLIYVKLYGRRLDEVSVDQIKFWLAETSRICLDDGRPLITLYMIGRKKYLQINNFLQRERASKFPAPIPGEHQPTLADTSERPQASRARPHSESESYSESYSEAKAYSNADSDSAPEENKPAPVPSDAVDRTELPPVSKKFRQLLEDEDGFQEFREVCEQGGVSGSKTDWDEARKFEWRLRDFIQRQAAIDGMKAKLAEANPDDPVWKSLPKNILKRSIWERRIRAPAGSKSDATKQEILENLRKRAAEEARP